MKRICSDFLLAVVHARSLIPPSFPLVGSGLRIFRVQAKNAAAANGSLVAGPRNMLNFRDSWRACLTDGPGTSGEKPGTATRFGSPYE